MKVVKSTPRRSIQTVMKRLAYISGTLSSKGMEDEAKSLETTIADLGWQCEELGEHDSVGSAALVRR
jgi:hypothetical protein